MLKRLMWGLGAASLALACGSGSGGNTLAAGDDAGGGTIETTETEPAGDNCEFGGVAVHSGQDRNGDGVLGAREIASTSYECDPAPELQSRLVITDLDVGDPDCPGGGTKMERGVDENRNGELDPDEVDSTDFLCNPVIEPVSRLVITTLDVGDPDCPGGGSRLDRGADLNGDGEIKGKEIESTNLICSEVQAPATLARAKKLELGSADCPDGGVAVLTGPDSNGDGVLSDEEVTETSLVCDDPKLVITCAVPYVWDDSQSGCVLRDDWSGESLHQVDLGNVYLAGIDFSGADLADADLNHAELRDANLSGANLEGADLSHTSVDGADLTGANLDGTDLTGVDLSDAVLDDISAVGLAACPEVLPDGWRCTDLGASGMTLTWPGMSLDGLDLTGATLTSEDLDGLQPLGIAGCPAQLPDGWVCTQLGDFGTSLIGSGADLGGLDLSGVDLSAATDLSDVSFAGSNLSGATFGDGTNLTGANFTGTDLSNATFGVNTDLADAFFADATLVGTAFGTGTNFDGTTIQRSNLQGVNLSNNDLTGVHAVGLETCPAALPSGWTCPTASTGPILAGPGADLSGVDLDGADLAGADLSGADLSGASLEGANLTAANLTNASLQGAYTANLSGCPQQWPPGFFCTDGTLLGPGVDLSGADLQGMDFGDVNLSGANLWGANLAQANLQDANLTGADLGYADLSGADLSGANLSRADLYGATVTGVVSEGVRWDLTVCPDGSYSGVGVDQGCFASG